MSAARLRLIRGPRIKSLPVCTEVSLCRDMFCVVSKKYRTNGYPSPHFVGDEDCLFLNIMRPDKISPVLRPVFIHIHGGGLKHGNSSGETVY